MIKETIFNIVKEFDKYSGPEDDAAFVSNAQHTLDQLRYLTRVIIEINRNTYSESMIAELEKALRECHEKKKDCDQLLQKECQNILNSRLEEVDVRNKLNKAYADGQDMYDLGKGGTLLTDIKLILTYSITSLILCYCSYDNIFPNAYNPIKSGLADIKDRWMKNREQSESTTGWIAYGKEFIFPKRDENMEKVDGLAIAGAKAADIFTNPATGIINLWKYELIHEVLTTTEEIEQKEMEVSMCMDIVVLRCLRKIRELLYEDALPTIIEGMLNSMPALKKDVQEQANIFSEARGADALGVLETTHNGTPVPAGFHRLRRVRDFDDMRAGTTPDDVRKGASVKPQNRKGSVHKVGHVRHPALDVHVPGVSGDALCRIVHRFAFKNFVEVSFMLIRGRDLKLRILASPLPAPAPKMYLCFKNLDVRVLNLSTFVDSVECVDLEKVDGDFESVCRRLDDKMIVIFVHLMFTD
ncbi:hypothetical protein CYMTET_15904 [Cymbomonas tetramitiformis]|uniref:Uncharacterized protein n=1 Tax=Cymbomonas tetramitiformis TaxID=36881 RepID=A0AAE0GDF4_9CHLO|nr:hypothetical protein CYMTET_15904 [Cymbomonas tetramitiformis]